MPCVKLKQAICEGSPATQPFDCSALHGLRAGAWGAVVFLWSDRRSSRIHVISCLGLPDESWAERKHILLAWVIALVFVRERESERRGRKYETRDIGTHVKAWVRVGCVHVFSASAKVCAPMFPVCVSRWPKYLHIPKPRDWRWPHLWRAPVNSLQVMMVEVWSKTGTGLAFGLLVQLSDL